METSKPNYRAIYTDIVNNKFPHKRSKFQFYLDKENWSTIDIIKLNQEIFGVNDKVLTSFNQTLRSYKKEDIIRILDFQKKNHLNNSQVASHFNMSRNTVAKWKKMFLI